MDGRIPERHNGDNGDNNKHRSLLEASKDSGPKPLRRIMSFSVSDEGEAICLYNRLPCKSEVSGSLADQITEGAMKDLVKEFVSSVKEKCPSVKKDSPDGSKEVIGDDQIDQMVESIMKYLREKLPSVKFDSSDGSEKATTSGQLNQSGKDGHKGLEPPEYPSLD